MRTAVSFTSSRIWNSNYNACYQAGTTQRIMLHLLSSRILLTTPLHLHIGSSADLSRLLSSPWCTTVHLSPGRTSYPFIFSQDKNECSLPPFSSLLRMSMLWQYAALAVSWLLDEEMRITISAAICISEHWPSVQNHLAVRICGTFPWMERIVNFFHDVVVTTFWAFIQ